MFSKFPRAANIFTFSICGLLSILFARLYVDPAEVGLVLFILPIIFIFVLSVTLVYINIPKVKVLWPSSLIFCFACTTDLVGILIAIIGMLFFSLLFSLYTIIYMIADFLKNQYIQIMAYLFNAFTLALLFYVLLFSYINCIVTGFSNNQIVQIISGLLIFIYFYGFIFSIDIFFKNDNDASWITFLMRLTGSLIMASLLYYFTPSYLSIYDNIRQVIVPVIGFGESYGNLEIPLSVLTICTALGLLLSLISITKKSFWFSVFCLSTAEVAYVFRLYRFAISFYEIFNVYQISLEKKYKKIDHVFTRLGMCYMKNGQFEKAGENYEKSYKFKEAGICYLKAAETYTPHEA